MTVLIIAGFFILLASMTMTMVGKGGGNFYVVILTIAGISMHEAAITAQFIIFSASVASMIIFQRNKSVSWSLAALVGTFTALSALGGGYFPHLFSGFFLKLIFAGMLLLAGLVMLAPVSENQRSAEEKHFGRIVLHSGSATYHINLWIAGPAMVLTGVGSGMVGVLGDPFWFR